MDYPHGHHHHNKHNHNGRREEEDPYRPTGQPPSYGVNERPQAYPPPPFYGGTNVNEPPPSFHHSPPQTFAPPPEVRHTSHSGPAPDYYPPPPSDYAPPPEVRHTSHSGPGPDYYPPPPSNYGPPPEVRHTSHSGPGPNYYPPPSSNYAPPSEVRHTSHSGPGPYSPPPSNYASPPPSVVDGPHHHHKSDHMPHSPSSTTHKTAHKGDALAGKPSVRMYTKAETNYSLTIRDGKVILARSDPSDTYQHWIKDEKYSTKVKDEVGFPSFALINKATGQAMKHSTGATQPVKLTPYNSKDLDESILWTESKDLGDGYRAIRMVNNIKLSVDAFHGDKDHGGVRDGTEIVLWEWVKGDNQRWKIVPY